MKEKIATYVLSLFLLLSLSVNIITITSLARARTKAVAIIDEARDALDSLSYKPFTFDLAVDKDLPLETEISVNQVIEIPIDINYPVDTTIYSNVNLPVVGTQRIAIPIKGNIPVKTTIEVPINMLVPVSANYSLETTIPVEISIPDDITEILLQVLDNMESYLK